MEWNDGMKWKEWKEWNKWNQTFKMEDEMKRTERASGRLGCWILRYGLIAFRHFAGACGA